MQNTSSSPDLLSLARTGLWTRSSNLSSLDLLLFHDFRHPGSCPIRYSGSMELRTSSRCESKRIYIGFSPLPSIRRSVCSRNHCTPKVTSGCLSYDSRGHTTAVIFREQYPGPSVNFVLPNRIGYIVCELIKLHKDINGDWEAHKLQRRESGE